MKGKMLLLAIGAAFVLATIGIFSIDPNRHIFTLYQIETNISWDGGPNVALNSSSMSQLNKEVGELIHQKTGDSTIDYPVISLGKRTVEVMYLSDKRGIPKELQGTLNAFIKRRILELAREQEHISS
jgi:hypothetical protein